MALILLFSVSHYVWRLMSRSFNFGILPILGRALRSLRRGATVRTMQDPPADSVETVFDLYSTQIDADPFPFYAKLRTRHPCYWSERNATWILSRYEDVARAAQDWSTYSSIKGNMIDELPGRAGAALGTNDPPRHDPLRALVQAAFGRKSIETLSEPTRVLAAA